MSQTGTTNLAEQAKLEKILNAKQFYFIENKGQWPEHVLFMAKSNSLRTWITKNSIVFEQFEAVNRRVNPSVDMRGEPKPIKAHAVGLEFVNPAKVIVKKGEPGPTEFNFIIGNDKSKHTSGCRQYSEVSVENIYEGIDMKYYFDNGELRYDYIVKQGANPDLIEMEIKGSDNFYIRNGEVVMETTLEPVVKKGLQAYQDNKQTNVNINFKITDNKLKFDIGDYDMTKELVIDPVTLAEFKKWVDGTGVTDAGIVIDENDSVYFGGYTEDPLFPVTFGPYIGKSDIIFGKIVEGQSLYIGWATFYGTDENERGGFKIKNNYLYFSGWTEGDDLLMVNAYQDEFAGARDCFFTVFNETGDTVKYSTYFGTEDYDIFNGIVIINNDPSSDLDNVYLIGVTGGASEFVDDFEFNEILTQNPNPFFRQGMIVGFKPKDQPVLEYDLLVASLFGGSGIGMTACIDKADIFSPNLKDYFCISGETASDSASFHITPDAYKTSNNGSDMVYVSLLHYDHGNTELVIDYNTYYSECDIYFADYEVLPIQYHNSIIYFAGSTNYNIPTTDNAYDTLNSVKNGGSEAFLAAINIDTSNFKGSDALIYSSYFGGDSTSGIKSIDFIERCEKIAFAGPTKGRLPDNYDGFTDGYFNHMVGIVDINQEETLEDLLYLNEGDYSYGNSIQHLNFSNNFLYTAGGGGHESHKAATIFKLSTNGTCPCPCYETWLTIGGAPYDPQDTCLFENQCQVVCSLRVENYFYSCYSHYKFDLGTGLSGFDTLDVSGEEIYKGCINAGDSLNVTVYLYNGTSPLDSCKIEKTYTCPCDCPSNVNDWLTITLDKESDSCEANECKVYKTWNIPPGYDCFTLFSQDSRKLQTMMPYPLYPELDIPDCIPEGEHVNLLVEFLRDSSDEVPCTIEKTIYCPVEEAAQPCYPDCPNDLWEGPFIIDSELDSCPGCKLYITYWTRVACPPKYYNDIQITKIEKFKDDPLANCELCLNDQVYIESVGKVIRKESLENNNPKKDSCSYIWRVAQASCWAIWNEYVITSEGDTLRITFYKPCNDDCCLRLMKVCRDEFDNINITDSVLISGYPECLMTYDDTLSTHIGTRECEYTCDILHGVNITPLGKSSEIDPEIFEEYKNRRENATFIQLRVVQEENYLRIFVEESNANNISINLFDLNGKLLINKTANVSGGFKTYDLNISNLLNGIYVYSIVVDGAKLETNKIMIIK
ncbi:T9SS type A sorting domain-containing protein [Bacteroidota bacterium]